MRACSVGTGDNWAIISTDGSIIQALDTPRVMWAVEKQSTTASVVNYKRLNMRHLSMTEYTAIRVVHMCWEQN